MAKKRMPRGDTRPRVARNRTIWDMGPLAYVPNGVIRRPLKVARAGVAIPAMLVRARRGDLGALDLPSFLGIGGARCGTTWLHFNLDAHPDICMPAGKELRFWDMNLSRGLKRYSAQFDCAPGQMVGEITPAYGIMDSWRVKLLAKVLPDLRFIYLLRDPVDRAWSHLAMWARRRNLSPEDLSDDQILDVLTSDPTTLHSTYSQVYRTYSSAFSREQIFVGFYEDLRQRPRQLMHDILVHIGARTDIDWEAMPLERWFNSGLGIENQETTSTSTMPDEYRAMLSKHFEGELRQLVQLFGEPAERWAAEAAAFAR